MYILHRMSCLLAYFLNCNVHHKSMHCTLDNVHNMCYTLRGCFACCFLNCNVHYRKSDRPSDWPARSVQLFAQRLTATNNQMHVGGQSCQPQENWPPCVPAKKNVSLNQTNRCWDDFPVPCQIFIELPQCLSTQQTTSDLGSNSINLSPYILNISWLVQCSNFENVQI